MTTNYAGQTTTSTPSVVTELSTVTGSNGATSVVTIIANNPTPFTSDGSHTGGSQYVRSQYPVCAKTFNALTTLRFFTNKGAVAGVFLIVGLAAASIVLFLFFFIKRRRRNRRLEYDTAVASTLAAAGYNRQPLDGDDYDENGGMRQRRRSSPSALATMSSLGTQAQQPYTDDPTGRRAEFDPYSAYSAVPPQTPPASARRDGYFPARTSSPPLGHSHSASTSSMGHLAGGHIPRESAGSFEPLLAAGGSAPNTPGPIAPSTSVGPPPTIPPKSPKRSPKPPSDEGHHPVPRDSASSVYSQPDGEAEDQLVDLTPRQPLEVRRLACAVRR